MNFHETDLGLEARFGEFLFFFGKRDAQLENLKPAYPGLEWARIRQTHSDLVVESQSPAHTATTEADAHFSATPNLALLISTADCVPVLIADSVSGQTAAIHAGWRGVENRIVPKTLQKILESGSQAKNLVIAVGPHIGFDSFEVDLPVRDQLLACVREKRESFHRLQGETKSFVDLRALVHSQIQEFGISADQIHDLIADTKTDLRFHSHRRDREKSGRQLSFSARIKSKS